jgi:hypothetical protein
MTRGQQLVLVVMVLLLLGVTVLLAYTLIATDDVASTVPTLAVFPAAVEQPDVVGQASDASVAPPTWTPEATRTPLPTDTPGPTHTAAPPPTITPTFLPTFTPRPTELVTPTPTVVTATTMLENPGFTGIGADNIPGWSWWAEDNFEPGGDYNPDRSFDTPLFKQADDPARFISGPTLQIDAVQHLKFKTHVYQSVVVSPNQNVGFQARAGAYSDTGSVMVAAGIDPTGGEGCGNARWGEILYLDQGQAVQNVVAPTVVAGASGRVTVCLYAEPLYAAVSNAAFFDDAVLTVGP